MTTWASSASIRHPWFNKPSMKRKHSPSIQSISDSDLSSRPKRRRCNTLESGFAHLTLGNPYIVDNLNANDSGAGSGPQNTSSYFPAESTSQPPHILEIPNSYAMYPMNSPFAMDASSPAILRPAFVEEPTSPRPSTPPTREIKMKSTHWYEPEPDRIVITDLDSSSEDEEGNEALDETAISISPALLQHIKSRGLNSGLTRDSKLPAIPSKALVLFKPLLLGSMSDEDGKKEMRVPVPDDGPDDDAMDIEL